MPRGRPKGSKNKLKDGAAFKISRKPVKSKLGKVLEQEFLMKFNYSHEAFSSLSGLSVENLGLIISGDLEINEEIIKILAKTCYTTETFWREMI
jgi:plasmid maintenance system antidote protein VapI